MSQYFSLLVTQCEPSETTELVVSFIYRLSHFCVYNLRQISVFVLFISYLFMLSPEKSSRPYFEVAVCIKATIVGVSLPTSATSLLVSDAFQIRPSLPEVIRAPRCWRLYYNKA
jgi:hypothetical protein